MHARHLMCLVIAALALCWASAAMAECPAAAKAAGDAAMEQARALMDQMESGESSTVLLVEPGTGTTVLPGAAPGEPRELTPEELERMEAARPDPGLPPTETQSP